MIKRAVAAVLGLLSLCLPLAAQQTNPSKQIGDGTIALEQLRHTGALDTAAALALDRQDLFSAVDSLALIHGLPVLSFLDGRRWPASSALARMGTIPPDLFPVAFLSVVEAQKENASLIDATDLPGGVVTSRLDRYYTGGEMGVFYGKSSGKFGHEVMQTYIMGTVGNEKFQITAGAAYQEWSGHVPRWDPLIPRR